MYKLQVGVARLLADRNEIFIKKFGPARKDTLAFPFAGNAKEREKNVAEKT